VAELEAKVEELRAMASAGNATDITDDIGRLEIKAAQALRDLYSALTPWQKTQVARHPQRPHCLDYINALVPEFIAFAGDRKFSEDGDRRRLRPVPRREHLRDRAREGFLHREPAQAQLRHGAAGRLPQGGAADGDGRPLRHPGAGAG
jgi:hypothetical protein